MKTTIRNPLFRLALLAVLALAFPATAPASPAPVQPPESGPVATASAGGGLNVPDVPQITDVICLTGCSTLRSSSPGGTVEISGRHLESVEEVSFRAARGRVRVRAVSTSATRVTTTVPKDAVSGTVIVIGFAGSRSRPSAATLTIGPAPRPQGRVRVTDASTSPSKAFQYGVRRPTLDFILSGGRAGADLRIDVVNTRGAVIHSDFLSDVPTGSPQKVTWSGKQRDGRRARNGAYRFVIRTSDGSEAALSKSLTRQQRKAGTSARAKDPFGFRMYSFVFPVKGPHYFGDGIGASRSGHSHQGIDILARCGLPIRAARAGTVFMNDYQASGAGNYLVINTKDNGSKSQVYMHMPVRSKFRKGARVKTGQVIGRVGTTGSSTACHLHFEEWSGPGWYQGGTFLNPLSELKKWDRYS